MSALAHKRTSTVQKGMSALPPKADIVRDTHGVRQLLVYRNSKREGDWRCHHQGELPVEQFSAEETLPSVERLPLHRLRLATG